MRIVNFSKNGTPTLAVRHDGRLLDLSVAAPGLPGDLRGLLAGGAAAMERVQAAAASAGDDARVDGNAVTWLPPLHNPEKVICLGLNYRDHAIETNNPIPTYPVVFMRFNTTLVGHGQPMVRLVSVDKPMAPRVPGKVIHVTYIADDFDELDPEIVELFEGRD